MNEAIQVLSLSEQPALWVDINYMPPKAVNHFWTKVSRFGAPPEHDTKLGFCWDWTGQILPQGYGVFRYSIAPYTYRQPLAHRIAYELVKGSIPFGMSLDHLCRNRRCCNPNHLEAVTPGENVRRGKGFIGVNFRKKHCPRGHKLAGANLVKSKLKVGKRSCLKCERFLKRERRWRQRRKNAGSNSQARITNSR